MIPGIIDIPHLIMNVQMSRIGKCSSKSSIKNRAARCVPRLAIDTLPQARRKGRPEPGAEIGSVGQLSVGRLVLVLVVGLVLDFPSLFEDENEDDDEEDSQTDNARTLP